MATALATGTNPQILEQAKQDVWNRLSGQQQELWLQAAATHSSNGFNTTQPQMAQQVPRSMSFTTTNFTQTPTPDMNSMDRSQSAPISISMGRSISTASSMDNGSIQRSMSTMSSSWQSSCEESSNDYTLYSESPMRKQPALQPIAETTTSTSICSNEGMVEYTPAEYMAHIGTSSSPSAPFPQHNPNQLHVQLTQHTHWSPSLDGSISPSTPSSTALMTPVTQASNPMSRQSSCNPQFLDGVSMLRVQSNSSMLPILSEDGSFSFPSEVDSKNISACVDTSFLSFTGPPSETFLSPAHVSASASALASSETQNQSYLAEDMRRSTSSSSSNASSASASSTCSRQSRRDREIMAQAERKIAPKAIESNDQTKSASSSVQMVRIQSEDGSSKNVGVLTKTPYIRPHHPKVMCPHCSERPEGFRGTHELDRHIARAHTKVRKGYICIDSSSNKKFLANCKHCRNKKVYGAYYNAAAHLRRAHFHPRKRGRKGKHDEKRGGIGGGDDPPMEILKALWIREVEVENKQIVQSPAESVSDSMDASTDNFDPAYDCLDASTSYTATQPTTDMPNTQIDSTQFVDYGMYVNSSDMFDASMQYATFSDPSSTNGDINSFQFDAYMTNQ